MNYFICSFDKSLLGIPSAKIEKILSFESSSEIKKQVSIPALFKLNDSKIVHALILKEKDALVLCPKIEVEIDVQEDSIKTLPVLLSHRFNCIQGLAFVKDDLVLLLDTDKLLEVVK